LTSSGGTAADVIVNNSSSGISSAGLIEFSIQELTPNSSFLACPAYSTFTSTTESWCAATVLGGSVWSRPAPPQVAGVSGFQDGFTYRIRVRARDNTAPIGNLEPVISSITFTFNETAPAVAITNPVPGSYKRSVATLGGTASGNFGVSVASIAVQEIASGYWWNGATFTAPGTKQWFTAILTGGPVNYTFSYTSNTLTFQDNYQYFIDARAEDTAGNPGNMGALASFTFDTSEPNSNFTVAPAQRPLSNLSAISARAADPNTNASGVYKTEVTIQRPDNAYWQPGGGWAGGAAVWLPTTGAPAWTKTTNLPPSDNSTGLLDGLKYTIGSRSVDVAGSTQAAVNFSTFTFDVTLPGVAVTEPPASAAGAVSYDRNGVLTSIIGSAGDTAPGSVSAVYVRLRDNIGLNYWNKDGVLLAPAQQFSLTEGQKESAWFLADTASPTPWQVWSTTQSLTLLANGNPYRVETRSLDTAGNYSSPLSTATFRYDNVQPQSFVNSPASGSTVTALTTITGTSTDAGALGGSGVFEIKVAIRRNSDNQWWGGVTFNNPIPAPFTLAGNPWSYGGLTSTDLDSGTSYYITSWAKDNAQNSESNYNVRGSTFLFDNAAPLTASTVPTNGEAYNGIAAHSRLIPPLRGTSSDATAGIATVRLSIQSVDDVGSPCFVIGVGFTGSCPTWQDVTGLFVSSWTFNTASLKFSGGHRYIVTSSGTDVIGNTQTSVVSNTFLYDSTAPVSSLTTPVNGETYQVDKIVEGASSDPGGANGSGVKAVAGWQLGKVQILVMRDEVNPNMTGAYGVAGCDAGSDYLWDGNAWVLATAATCPGGATPLWVNVNTQFNDTAWEDSSLNNKWVKGRKYVLWTRAIDNAGNTQADVNIAAGPRFQIADSASTFAVDIKALGCGGATLAAVNAGADYCVEVRALDSSGFGALAYGSTVTFAMQNIFDAPGSGPEIMDTDNTVDDVFGLPKQYKFIPADLGFKQFDVQLRLRRASQFGASRRLVATDLINATITGSTDVVVNPMAGDRIMMMVQGEAYEPGKMTAPQGRGPSPTARIAGNTTPVIARVADQYWNTIFVSTTVTLVTSDPFDTNPGVQTFVGSTTINVTLIQAGTQTVTATGAGIETNLANPSSEIPVASQLTPTQLLALMPGETRVQGASPGKTGTVDPQVAGSTFAVTVYGVDQFYNTVASSVIFVTANIPSDIYAPVPATQALASGATTFIMSAVIAATHTVRAQALAAIASPIYTTPNSVKVWWGRPVRFQLIGEGQTAAPGKPTYVDNSIPPSGGRLVSTLSPLESGTTTNLTVNLVDNYYNVVRGTTLFLNTTVLPVSSYTFLVELQFPTDPNIQARGLAPTPYERGLLNGTTQFSVIPVTRQGNFTIRARDTTANYYSTDTIVGIIVDPGPAVSLQVLVSSNPGPSTPGEVAVEGSPSGKTGSPGPLTAGSPYDIAVRAVDKYWNLVAAETRNV
ncbi:MAG: hypothetical protein AAB131_18480, partial [Actinomycetota bacterium]